MSQEQPLVSIGMPVFNCESTLEHAIRSILNQTYSNWELILIDDGSQDRTTEVVQQFQDPRIQLISDGKNLKLPSRLNQAIAIGKGKYFARMDGDDIAYPERFQRQVEYLETHSHIDLLGTQVVILSREGQAVGMSSGIQSHGEICDRPWSGFALAHPTWMGKMEWFRRYRYRSNAIRMEDYDLLLRSYQTSQFACLPDVLLGYRVGSLSLRNILKARYCNFMTLIGKGVKEQNLYFAYGALAQGAKALVDTVAIISGLQFNILPHRLGYPIPITTLEQWQTICHQYHYDSDDSQRLHHA